MLKGEKKEKKKGPQARALYLQPATSSTVVAIVKVQTEDDESQGQHQAISMVIPEQVAPPQILYFYFEWNGAYLLVLETTTLCSTQTQIYVEG